MSMTSGTADILSQQTSYVYTLSKNTINVTWVKRHMITKRTQCDLVLVRRGTLVPDATQVSSEHHLQRGIWSWRVAFWGAWGFSWCEANTVNRDLIPGGPDTYIPHKPCRLPLILPGLWRPGLETEGRLSPPGGRTGPPGQEFLRGLEAKIWIPPLHIQRGHVSAPQQGPAIERRPWTCINYTTSRAASRRSTGAQA